jgi:hypothetical protein
MDLTIKIIERAKVIRKKLVFYYYQMSKGIRNILAHAKTGIREFINIRVKKPYKQLQFKFDY